MSRYLTHLAELTLNQLEPVQPLLASRFEMPVENVSYGHGYNSLDVVQESSVAPPAHGQPSTVTATDNPGHVEMSRSHQASRFEMPNDRDSSNHGHISLEVVQKFSAVTPAYVQPSTETAKDGSERLEAVRPHVASRFEMLVDKGQSDHNGPDLTQESRATEQPAHLQPSAETTTDSPDRVNLVQPRLYSRFETPVNNNPSDHIGLNTARESRTAVPPAHTPHSTVTAKESPVVQKIMTVSSDVQTKKEFSGQDKTKVLAEPAGFMINQSESSGDQHLPSLNQGLAALTTLFNTEQASRADQPVNKPVTRSSYVIRKEDTLPPENAHTVQREQGRFTETSHGELVIRELAAPDAHKKISKPEGSQRAAPVKPASIVLWSEQSTAGPNTASQTGVESVSVTQFGTDPISTPAIHVTIGRIEIRATQVADKPIARPRAASNTMSLDDYLNRRNGGKS